MSVGDAVISTDVEGRVKLINPAAQALTGWQQEEACGRRLEEVFHIINEETRQRVDSPVQQVLREGVVVGLANHTLLLAKDGAERPVADSGAPIRNEQQQIVGVVLVFRDQTQERAAQEAVGASEVRYRRLFESAKDGILILDGESGMVVDANPFLAELLGFSREECLGKTIWELGAFKAIAADPARFSKLQDQDYIRYEDLPLETRDGRRIDVELVSNTYLVNRRKVVQCNIRSIAERKRAEAELRSSLEEKTALLKEVHHRVKNNLQIISSLLNLQSGQIKSPEARAALQNMQGRVRSMGLIHKHLYQSPNLAQVDLTAYIKNLCAQLLHALAASPGAVRLQLDLAPVHLGMDQAIPCGLMVNELVSNSLKHAFPEGRAGEVRVELQPVPGSPALRLRVADNGTGLPAAFDLKNLKSLGLELVGTLTRQLQGKLEISPGPGAAFDIVFVPKPHKPITGWR